ncbi:hypothetical protein JCM19241_3129 [Vibrio ishigakensis]|uniref:Uncharacterized protein n=1 Tax=Vibrio ishigakensis TaxID=1481914 RepID=A0A0B8QGB7_9VIBR|nr:hypothetical protein JCM19241_3129 [Vibrio ishigakensis]
MANKIKNQGVISIVLTLCLLFASTMSTANTSIAHHPSSDIQSSLSHDCCEEISMQSVDHCFGSTHNCGGQVCGTLLSLPSTVYSFTFTQPKPSRLEPNINEQLPEFTQQLLRPPIV